VNTTVAFDFSADRATIDAALADVALDATQTIGPGSPVAKAVAYSLAGEGKRLRGMLLLASYRAAGGAGDVSALAAAVEVIHAYSLVHDDLPCMDDDDMRRGRPTVHRVHGVPAATAAGLAMVPLAGRTAARGGFALGLNAAGVTRILRELMRASGAGGMVGGQLLDLEGEGRPLSLPELERMHRAKTGALIAASVTVGAIAANAAPRQMAALEQFGVCVGLAFQIADDVLDLTATTAELGKTAGRDVVMRKSTYPALLGIDGATTRAAALVAEGCSALSGAAMLTPALEALAQFITARRS
jgi:geranylgeranyl pyrophosphate synthase